MVFFLIFQIVSLRLRKLPFLRVMVGILYTYAGLVLFLTGVNVGFSPVGYALGAALTEGWMLWLLIPLAMLMGWFIINAEPAVHTLNKQVEELSAGAISAKAMGMSLSIAVSAAGGLAMLRVITGRGATSAATSRAGTMSTARCVASTAPAPVRKPRAIPRIP